MNPGPRSPLVAADLTLLRWALEPSIDAGGRRLAYVVSGPDLATDRLDHRVVIADVDGPAVPLGGDRPTRRPRWSRDGGRLGLLAGDGAGRWSFVVRGEGGELSFPLGPARQVGDFSWSPDGRQVALELAEVGGTCVAVAELATGKVSDIAGLAGASRPQWATAGTRLALTRGREVWVADAGREATPRRVLRSASPVRAMSWSPDGGYLAVLGTVADAAPWANTELIVVDVTTGEVAVLGGDLDRSIGQAVRGDDERGTGVPSLAWTSDGSAVLAVVADGGRSAIVAFALDGRAATVVVGDRPAVLEFDVANDGTVAYTWSDPLTPGEVSVVGADGRERYRSDLTAPLRSSRDLAPTRVVRAPGVEGWLTTPAPGRARQRWPLVVQLHGGPHYPVGERFSFDAQRFASAGLATLRLNPRGSQGYGRAHAAAIAGDWGGVDAADAEAAFSGVCTPENGSETSTDLGGGGVDGDRIAFVGESYGGFLALTLAARNTRVRAVVAENAVCDLLAGRSSNPEFWDAQLAIERAGAEERAAARSPLARAGEITAPLLLIRSEEDSVVAPAQSQAMLAAVRAAGTATAELLTVAGEGHFVNVFGTPSRRIAKLRAVDEFLADHLLTELPATELTAPGTGGR